MANVKNFGLIGVGSDVQFGKAGTRIINNAGVFTLKAADGALDAALAAAGITSSGNLSLSTAAGKVVIEGADILGKTANGHTHLFGTSGVVLPTGTTEQRGTAELGQLRVNNDVVNGAVVEFYDGDEWATLATGGNADLIQAEIDAIEASLGGAVNADGTFNGAAFTGSALGATSLTDAVNLLADITANLDSNYVNITGDTMQGDLNLGNFKITGLASPVAGGDATNKAYVDNIAAGLTWKDAVNLLADTNVALTGSFTGFTIDGVELAAANAGTRILLTGQTQAEENGIYVLTDATGGDYELVRSADTDAADGSELVGAAVFVIAGTTFDNTGWVQSNHELTGFAGQSWVQFSGGGAYSAGDGLSLSGTTFSVNMGAGVTTLPTDEVGLDIASNIALQLTSLDTTGQLTLVLADASGLSQSALGLTIAAAGVTNDMLLNSGFALAGNTGTGAVALGETLTVSGADAAITVTAANGTLSVQLNTVDVAHGGTGLTSVAEGQVLFGGADNTIVQDAGFSYTPTTGELTVGGANIAAPVDGGVTIASTNTDGDITLVPNGAGSVVIGNPGAGIIEAGAGQTLTVTGNNTLVLESTSGDVVVKLAAGSVDKVTVAGPTAEEYATDLAAADLVNKHYVDQVAAAGAVANNAGTTKAVKAVVSLATTGSTNIGSLLPAGATVLRVKVQVAAADTGTATLSVGKAGAEGAYMLATECDAQTLGIYIAETFVTEDAETQVVATVAGAAAAGSANVIVEYQLA